MNYCTIRDGFVESGDDIFVSEYSDVTQRIPQYLIASYVGVKAPSLSRIRRRFTRNIS